MTQDLAKNMLNEVYDLQHAIMQEQQSAPEPHWAGPDFDDRSQRIRLLTMQVEQTDQLRRFATRLMELQDAKVQLDIKKRKVADG